MTGDGVDGSVAAFVPTKVRALLEITLHDLGPGALSPANNQLSSLPDPSLDPSGCISRGQILKNNSVAQHRMSKKSQTPNR